MWSPETETSLLWLLLCKGAQGDCRNQEMGQKARKGSFQGTCLRNCGRHHLNKIRTRGSLSEIGRDHLGSLRIDNKDAL